MENKEIVFEDWEAALRSQVPADRQRRYREAIVKFRYWLRLAEWPEWEFLLWEQLAIGPTREPPIEPNRTRATTVQLQESLRNWERIKVLPPSVA